MTAPCSNGNATLPAKYTEMIDESKLQNHVRVVARIRPLSERERSQQGISGTPPTRTAFVETLPRSEDTPYETVIQVQEISHEQNRNSSNNNSSNNNSSSSNKRWFELDAVLDPGQSQAAVYQHSGAQSAVTHDLFQGFNCTILAYGQTGSGKTYTMGTTATNNDTFDDNTAGIIPRATADLFAQIDKKCDGNARVTLSYMEIYNEEIRDLLLLDDGNSGSKSSGKLRIRETLQGDVYVHGLTHQNVSSPAEIGKYMEQAASRRKVAATEMNAVSSRSHAICTLTIQGVINQIDLDEEGNDDGDKNKDNVKFQSKLTLVDLAGSERIKKTAAVGSRAKEGININKGLLVLGQVISALAEQRPKYKRKPPYRDSKLTRLLQDSLGGNSRTIMVACVSPAESNLPETINTLRYATSARNIRNSATQNVVQTLTSAQVQQLQRQNQLLQVQVKELQGYIQSWTHPHTALLASHVTPVSDDELSTDNDGDDSADTYDESDEEAAYKNRRIRALEKEIRVLKRDLHRQRQGEKREASQHSTGDAKTTISAAAPNGSVIPQNVADTAIQVCELHKKVSQLEQELENKAELESENENLRLELEQAKADAHAALLAANKMSNILDQLQKIKSAEINKKKMENEHMKVEEAWVHFVVRLQENNRAQMLRLKEDFAFVARVLDSAEVREASALSSTMANSLDVNNNMASQYLSPRPPFPVSSVDEHESTGNSGWYSRLKKIPNQLRQDTTGRLAWSIHGGSASSLQNSSIHARCNSNVHGGREASASSNPDPASLRQKLLYEHIQFFNDKLMEVEREMTAESESLASIKDSLRKQRDNLERDIGASEYEHETLQDRGQDKDLLEELTMLLVGPVKNLGDYS